jgi:K+-dependent Na+/Ca+ exchanger-like protein
MAPMKVQTQSTSQQQMKKHRRRRVLGNLGPKFAVLVAVVALAAVSLDLYAEDAAASISGGAAVRRKLYDYEPGVCDSFLVTNYRVVAMCLLMWGIFYMFWGLAIVCDDYFVTSLEDISEALHLSSDVAGATFMAAGSSAPELFTSLMGVFAVKNDVGIGTIVGSAVFNLCCIIGGTALFTPVTLKIDWKPITRDTLFYAMSIFAMIYVLKDGLVTLYEAIALICLYVVYVTFMAFNQSFMDAADKCCGTTTAAGGDDDGDKEEEEEDEDESPIAKAVARPLNIIFEVTIPNCSLPHNKNKYLITFTCSIMWIGVLSYFMVTWASKLGCIWNIHPAIMGVTVLAAGTSVPDAIGSLLVARDGQGDMAVSNAIGSNVFDILLGLGLPWTLSGLIWPDQPGVPVDAEALLPLSIILVATLAAVYLVALVSGFRLTKCVGLIFFSFYFIFVAYDLLHEFDKIPF